MKTNNNKGLLTNKIVKTGFPGINPLLVNLTDPTANWTIQVMEPGAEHATVIAVPKGGWAGIVSPNLKWGAAFISQIMHKMDDRNYPGITLIENKDGGVVTVLYSIVEINGKPEVVYAVVKQERPRVTANFSLDAAELKPWVETAPARGFAATDTDSMLDVFKEEIQELGIQFDKAFKLVSLGSWNTNNAWSQQLGPDRGLEFVAAEVPAELLTDASGEWRFDTSKITQAGPDNLEPIEDTLFITKKQLLDESRDMTSPTAAALLEKHLEETGRAKFELV